MISTPGLTSHLKRHDLRTIFLIVDIMSGSEERVVLVRGALVVLLTTRRMTSAVNMKGLVVAKTA